MAYFTNAQYQREDWRGLNQQISNEFSPEETILIFSFPEAFSPWVWYDNHTYPTLSTGQLHISQVPDLHNLLKSVVEYEYVLVFDYLRDLTDPTDQLGATLRSIGYQEAGVLDYANIGFVRIYTRPESLLSENVTEPSTN
jgi:hypothetical protein